MNLHLNKELFREFIDNLNTRTGINSDIIEKASVDELCEIEGITRELAIKNKKIVKIDKNVENLIFVW